MKVITQRDLIKGVADRWRNTFAYSFSWAMDDREREIGVKLQELINKNASAKEIDDVIGHNGWTTLFCHECGETVTEAISFCDDDEESFCVCFSCFNKARDMMSKKILEEKDK